MLKLHVHRLTRRLFILFVLAVALLATSNPAERKVKAFVSCAECETRYSNCLASCEPCSSAALFRCENRHESCLLTCD